EPATITPLMGKDSGMQTHTELPKKSGRESSRELQTHPFVERLKPEPDQPPRQVTVLTGLPGESDRDGYYRFYLNAKLDYYAECRIVDLVYVETISPEQSPFDGLEATR